MTSPKVEVVIPDSSGIIIVIEKVQRTEYGVKFVKHMTIRDDVEQWAVENNIEITDMLPVMLGRLYFNTHAEAILFKLRWL